MNTPGPITLRTPRLTLRPAEEGDAARFLEIQSNWEVIRWLRTAPYPPTLPGLSGWLAGHAEEWRRGRAYRFAVIEQDQVIGCADVNEITDRRGDLGYWLDQRAWGRGLASEAAVAVRDFAFRVAGLSCLISGHAADNPASGAVLVKLGFRHIGDETRWSTPRRTEILQRVYKLDDSPP